MKEKTGTKTILLGKDSAFNVGLDLPGVFLSIIGSFMNLFRLNDSMNSKAASKNTKNKYE